MITNIILGLIIISITIGIILDCISLGLVLKMLNEYEKDTNKKCQKLFERR